MFTVLQYLRFPEVFRIWALKKPMGVHGLQFFWCCEKHYITAILMPDESSCLMVVIHENSTHFYGVLSTQSQNVYHRGKAGPSGSHNFKTKGLNGP